MKRCFVGWCAVLLAGACFADTISLNFTGTDGAYALGASDLAGLVGNESGNTLGSTMAANWNNLDGNTGSGVGNLTASGGAVVDGVTASWNADSVFSLSDTTLGANTSANTTMMRGFLDNASEGTTTITVSGLEALSGTYSVIVYLDGGNGDEWRRGTYTIGGTSVVGEDSEGVDFNSGSGDNANGLFQIPVEGGAGGDWPVSPNNSEGNVIIFSGLTGSGFTLTATPGDASNMDVQRAAVNGVQIVGVVPEPAVVGLMAVVGGAAVFIRRRFVM